MALIQPLLVGCFTSSHVPEPVACIRFKIGLANTLFLAHEWKNDELFNSGNRAIFSAQLILLQPKKGWLLLPFAKQWHPTPVLLLGESHGRRSLVGCSPWGRWESDTTERLHFHFSLSSLEKEMATHSGVFAWRIPGMREPGGLQSMGSHRVRQDWSDLVAAAEVKQTVKHVCFSYMFPNPRPGSCFYKTIFEICDIMSTNRGSINEVLVTYMLVTCQNYPRCKNCFSSPAWAVKVKTSVCLTFKIIAIL